MIIFLDTSIFVCSTIDFENQHEETKSILKGEYKGTKINWITSRRVVDELISIRKRREKIYKQIITYDYKMVKNKILRDFYNECFKTYHGSNKNDNRHIDNLFTYAQRATGLDMNERLDQNKLDLFRSKIYPTIRKIKVYFGKIVYDFNDPVYNSNHVVTKTRTSTSRRLQRQLRNDIPKSSYFKEDIRIVIDAIEEAYDRNAKITFLSTDFFFNDNKDRIENAVRRIYKNHPGIELVLL